LFELFILTNELNEEMLENVVIKILMVNINIKLDVASILILRILPFRENVVFENAK
jgi:hypothetical protein